MVTRIVVKFVPDGGREVRVRLLGIDSPEVFGTAECGGNAASKTLKRILPKGRIVLLVSDPTQLLKDRFGRLLRYVMKNDLDVNRRQVYLGHARLFLVRRDPFERARSYRVAATAARETKRGLWGNCT
jgi:endonuclease YncB( thermonuclease family)